MMFIFTVTVVAKNGLMLKLPRNRKIKRLGNPNESSIVRLKGNFNI